jgi:4-hydroxybenzoate polyprenyltransferase
VLIVDVLVLSGLYTLRVVAGGIAVDVSISSWLGTFSLFLFLGLAFVKRYSELCLMQERNQTYTGGRGYIVRDIEILRSIGPTSCYISVLVLTLYLNSKEVAELYSRPEALWLIIPLLSYWITRIWFLAHRREIQDDPIVFTIHDPTSYIVGAIIMIIMIMAALW